MLRTTHIAAMLLAFLGCNNSNSYQPTPVETTQRRGADQERTGELNTGFYDDDGNWVDPYANGALDSRTGRFGDDDDDGGDGRINNDGGGGDPDDAPPPSNLTKGSGGQKGPGSGRSQSGLEFLYDVPQDNGDQKAHGLLVLLHGSSASNYNNMVRMMSNVAAQHGLIRVSVLAPNGRGWNEGGESQAANSLHQLIQQDLYPKYNIDKNKIFFSGQSSGAGFLATHFVPLHAKDYKGGAFMQCGMQPPRVNFSPDAATKANFKLHFEITTGDGIWTSSYQPTLQAYRQAGMQLTDDNTKSGGHCAFDQQQVIADRIGPML